MTNIHISADDATIVRNIIASTVPHKDIWIFGSRATGKRVRPQSDLDVYIETLRPITLSELGSIRDKLSGSSLPFRVDIVTPYDSLSDDMRATIERERKPL